MTEKEFAYQIKRKYMFSHLEEDDLSALCYPAASVPVENLNIEELSKELEKYQLKVSKGCDLGHISKRYVREWNKYGTIFIYADECNL